MVKQVASSDAFEEFAVSLFRFNRMVRSTGHLWVQLPGNLKRSDITILRTLKEYGDSRPGCIAEHLGIGASVISRQLVSLTEEGLVVRRKDPDDGRAELIRLTDSGDSRLRAIREAYVAGMRSQFTDWDTAKVSRAAALLDEVSDHIAPALGGRDLHTLQAQEA
ncbi:MAG: MarR family transcriptional regulator [Nocardioides sp.]|nr:MarR family transcriptional regulator [Nocardioides sp.]